MQVLTVSQFRQLQLTVTAAWDALQIVEDVICQDIIDPIAVALTSDRAIAAYRITAKTVYHSVMLAAAAAFYAGVLTRQGWELFLRWRKSQASCEAPIEVSPMPEGEAPEPVAEVLPPDQMVVNPSPTLLLPPAKIEPTAEAPKKRGRPRKAAIA